MFTKHTKDQNRLKDMLEMRSRKIPLRIIGEKYGITRERVRQIIGNTGNSYKFLKNYRKREILSVKTYLRINNKELARLYNCENSPQSFQHYFNGIRKIRKYKSGYKRCCDCRKILLYSFFYDNCSRCKKCTAIATYKSQKKSGYSKKYYEDYRKGGPKHKNALPRIICSWFPLSRECLYLLDTIIR